ncbi:MAG: hypothetical protein A2Y36_14090 [Treponema sp. GWA1_62_8]|nr:MAG: hypothetical protein A2Y36_14090 [Treponema sp. GWA1_62_8]
MNGQRLPKRISPCPISEAIFELRFTPKMPEEAVFGVVYSAVREHFPGQVENLFPIQLPEALRRQDPNLQYAAQYRLRSENKIMSIGPRTISFSNTAPYLGWTAWSGFIQELLGKIRSTGVFGTIERTGLRYLNVFERRILDGIRMKLSLNDSAIIDESTTIRTEFLKSGIVSILQVNNNVEITVGERSFRGSLIDIDCLANLGESQDDFFMHSNEVIERSHNREKELFYSLLTSETLAMFNPEYEEKV